VQNNKTNMKMKIAILTILCSLSTCVIAQTGTGGGSSGTGAGSMGNGSSSSRPYSNND
jgi:hypothetical protein